jgi:hypothetical protein
VSQPQSKTASSSFPNRSPPGAPFSRNPDGFQSLIAELARRNFAKREFDHARARGRAKCGMVLETAGSRAAWRKS